MAFNDRNQNVKSDVEQACQVALDFVKRYYESLDRRRHLMSRLYQDTAILVWNGNGIMGKEDIQKFLSELPSCDHTVKVLDSQKILDSAVSNQLAYSILATGIVKYTGKPTKQFAENFIITAEGERWKIVSDSFRFQEFVSKDVVA